MGRYNTLENSRLVHLDELEELGISMKQVTDQLEVEGVKAFSDAFTVLIKIVEERRIAALS